MAIENVRFVDSIVVDKDDPRVAEHLANEMEELTQDKRGKWYVRNTGKPVSFATPYKRTMSNQDVHRRCCGRKPRPYKRKGWMLCTSCDRAYDLTTGEQVENFAWVKRADGVFVDRLTVKEERDILFSALRVTD
jgi:hypothetical protein